MAVVLYFISIEICMKYTTTGMVNEKAYSSGGICKRHFNVKAITYFSYLILKETLSFVDNNIKVNIWIKWYQGILLQI